MSCSLCSLRQLLQFRPFRGKTHEVCNILGSRCTKPSKRLRVGGCWRYLYLYCKQYGDKNTCYIIPMLIWCNVSPILVSPFLPANSVFYSWSFLCQIDTTQSSSHSASLTTHKRVSQRWRIPLRIHHSLLWTHSLTQLTQSHLLLAIVFAVVARAFITAGMIRAPERVFIILFYTLYFLYTT